MNSSNISSNVDQDRKQIQSQLDKTLPLDVQLTYDQFIILQHYLPKKYALIELKHSSTGSRRQSNTGNHHNSRTLMSSHHQQEKQNVSRLSGLNNNNTNNNFENSEVDGSRSKRSRIKKVDRYLDEEPIIPKEQPKRSTTQKIYLDEQMTQCLNILNTIKKHRSCGPFLYPVDPQTDGVYDYFDKIKEPMDLTSIENSLKNGQYQTAGQFHGDMCKIWHNSYAYNEKNSPVYKMTVQMEKYYKNLLANDNGIVMGSSVTKGGRSTNDKSKSKDRKRQSKNDEKKRKKADKQKQAANNSSAANKAQSSKNADKEQAIKEQKSVNENSQKAGMDIQQNDHSAQDDIDEYGYD